MSFLYWEHCVGDTTWGVMFALLRCLSWSKVDLEGISICHRWWIQYDAFWLTKRHIYLSSLLGLNGGWCIDNGSSGGVLVLWRRPTPIERRLGFLAQDKPFCVVVVMHMIAVFRLALALWISYYIHCLQQVIVIFYFVLPSIKIWLCLWRTIKKMVHQYMPFDSFKDSIDMTCPQ
jgi:hypothetical protein